MAYYSTLIFPTDISYNSDAALVFDTEALIQNNGDEVRIAQWANPLRVYNVAWGVRTLEQLAQLRNVFRVAEGRRHSFLFRDPLDYTSTTPTDEQARAAPDIAATDQNLGTGDGTTTTFQLRKAYTAGSETYYRRILTPEAASMLVAVDGTPTTAYSLDSDTGIITFDSAPGSGLAVTAGFRFYVPVRFDIDELPINLETYGVGGATVRLIEVRTLS